jgi:hypothetical protein
MSRGEAASHIRIEDDKGRALPDELLPGEELWDTTFRRRCCGVIPKMLSGGSL